ncbi:MAG: lipid IV(A) 3-deoxy-D-manno-octulosonic acid transferase [Oleispira sp.]|nr:lipid IV(A) 3-deoxy-D-manno-octulosonic acid transferase [Oleispira sp.]
MARFLYNLVFTLAIPFLLIRMWLRGGSNPGYRQRWAERFAFFKFSGKANGLLVHSVSVGETLAAEPLVRSLQTANPDLTITITTTTPTGSDQVKRLYADDLAAGRIFHVYLPYDLPWLMSRFIKKVQPSICIIMETELWPNIIRSCNKQAIPVILANARLSEKSAKGYGKFSKLTQPMLQGLDLVAAQHRSDAERFINLGIEENRVDVTGSIKFDISVPEQAIVQGAELKQHWGEDRPVLVLVSSHEGEDDLILNSYQQLLVDFPDLLLTIVPRHPEHFDEVAALILDRELQLVRRSEAFQKGSLQANPMTQVYLADTMGEMLVLLASADIAIIGGSFIEHGGHNPLEACALAKAVVMGPSDYNFAAISQQLMNQGAMQQASREQLTICLRQLLERPELRADMGANGQRVVADNQGAVGRLTELVAEQLHR